MSEAKTTKSGRIAIIPEAWITAGKDSDSLLWLAGPLMQAKLSGSEFAVLVVLLMHDGPGGCYPALDQLESITGTTSSTVTRALESLEKKNIIGRKRTKGGRGQSTRYTIKTPAEWQPFDPDGKPLRTRTKTPAKSQVKHLQNGKSNTCQSARKTAANSQDEQPREHLIKHHQNQTSGETAGGGLAGGGVSKPADGRTGRGRGFGTVTVDDLQNNEQLHAVYQRLVAAGTLPDSERGRAWCWEAAVHALRIGDNPGALFRSTIVNDRRDYITAEDEAEARRRLAPPQQREAPPKRAPVVDFDDDDLRTDEARELAQMRANGAFNADPTPAAGIGDVLARLERSPTADDPQTAASKRWFEALTDEQIQALITQAEAAGERPITVKRWRDIPRGQSCRVGLSDRFGPYAKAKAAG